MKPVERAEILDYQTYEERRPVMRAKALAEKEDRRVLLGGSLTFLFENRETVRYQVQEMMRTEKIVREADILHELETYNELLGRDGELGCTLLIGIAEAGERAAKLARWRELPRHLFVRLDDGTRVPATFDPRQVGDERLSSVQYLRFPVGRRVPVTLGCDLVDPELGGEVELPAHVREAMRRDLAG